jgi:hypothetical protein
MKNIKKETKKMIVYQTKSGAIEFRSDLKNETIWATQAQIAEIFNCERSVVTKHIRNIFKDKELNINSVCAKIAHTAADGKVYDVQVYNLDVVLAIGYRTNSSKAIIFRQWATKTLRSYIVDGYAINRTRVAKNYDLFLSAVEEVKALLPGEYNVDNKSILELIKSFSQTWLSLDAYDKDLDIKGGLTKKAVKVGAEELVKALQKFKSELLKTGEATDLFGTEEKVVR